MLRPFVAGPALQTPFPPSNEFIQCLSGSANIDRLKVARLWMTEGCPSAFKNCPAVYEDLRGWLGSRLGVHAKEITLVGSARLGYSLSPKEFGRAFGPGSDLDLLVVSEKLFLAKSAEFLAFVEDYRRGDVQPRNVMEEKFWPENAANIPRNIRAGFLHVDRIPRLDRYPLVQSIADLMWRCKAKLDATAGAPNVKRISVRIYQNWESCVNQIALNLKLLAAPR